jgi:hypothetical protein
MVAAHRTRRPIVVVALIDALGWKCIEGREFLTEILPHRGPLKTVLGYSSAAIPTLLTGLPPAEHGHWNLFYHDPEGSPFGWLTPLRFLPDSLLNNRVSRKIIKELGRRVLGLGPLFECNLSPKILPQFNYVEKRDILAPGGIVNVPSILDEIAVQGIAYRVYSYRQLPDAQIVECAARDIAAGAASFFLLYLSEMDAFLHMHCTEREALAERLQWYEKKLMSVFRAARAADPGAIMAVVSDHGMTPVTRHFDLAQRIAGLTLKMLSDYLVVYDSTMARFWFFSERAKESIGDCLSNLSCGEILTDEDLRRLGVQFGDRRYGQLVFLLRPGWLFSQSNFNGHSWQPRGMHGYDPADSFSDAIFLSDRFPSVPMRTIADIHPWLQTALGLRDAPPPRRQPQSHVAQSASP